MFFNEMELLINNLEELETAAEKLLAFAGDRKKWCFYGELGTGKTTFIKVLCKYLNVQESVTSPTYSLVNEYTYHGAQTNAVQYLYHMDLYRLKQIEEALDIGIEDYLDDPNYCFIEWAEIIEPILPDDVVSIHIELIEESIRKMTFR